MALPRSLIGPIHIERHTVVGAYVDGEWIAGNTDTVTVTGLITPERDVDIINRDGGGYSDGVIKIYTNEILYAHDKLTGREGDRITRNGRVYEVYEVNDVYSNLSTAHYRSRARRIDEKVNGC